MQMNDAGRTKSNRMDVTGVFYVSLSPGVVISIEQ